MMNTHIRIERKAYALQRMVQAIGRAIASSTDAEKDRAARWAAAWGVLGGIHTRGIRLRRSCLSGTADNKGGARLS